MSKKLCGWDKKKIKNKFDDLTELVKNPKYVCERCARAAGKKENLCKPVKIKKEKL